MKTSDFLVIGSGVAGLFFALRAARTGTVAVVTKRGRTDSNTNWAQGGIAAVLSPEDSFESHIQDTLVCGAGACRKDIVDLVVRAAPARIHDLIDLGVNFTREGDHLAMGREGGHSARRIVYSQDRTGQVIQETLVRQALDHPNISFYADHMAVDLIQDRHLEDGAPSDEDGGAVYGAYILDVKADRIERFVARRSAKLGKNVGDDSLHGGRRQGLSLHIESRCRHR